MHGSIAHPHATRTQRAHRLWPGLQALVLVLAACSPASPAGSASDEASPSGGPAASLEASVAETPQATSSAETATLTGTWDGTWAIDPPYEASVGTFTMELVQGTASRDPTCNCRPFSGTVEITNTDCSNGSVDGTINGTTITFGWLLTPQPVQFTGELDSPTSMSGTWSANACSDSSISLTGTWEATKS